MVQRRGGEDDGGNEGDVGVGPGSQRLQQKDKQGAKQRALGQKVQKQRAKQLLAAAQQRPTVDRKVVKGLFAEATLTKRVSKKVQERQAVGSVKKEKPRTSGAGVRANSDGSGPVAPRDGEASVSVSVSAVAKAEPAPSFRGPLKAAFKQWKHQQAAEPGAAAPDSAAVVSPDTAATAAAVDAVPRKRLMSNAATAGGLDRQARPGSGEGAGAATRVSAGSGGSSGSYEAAAAAAAGQGDEVLQPSRDPMSAAAAAAAAIAGARRRAGGAGPANSGLSAASGSIGSVATSRRSSQAQGPSRAGTNLGAAAAAGDYGGFGGSGRDKGMISAKRRSEVDRRLDSLLGASGRLREPSKANIVKVLRMYNLCDMSPAPAPRYDAPAPTAAAARQGASSPALPPSSPALGPGGAPAPGGAQALPAGGGSSSNLSAAIGTVAADAAASIAAGAVAAGVNGVAVDIKIETSVSPALGQAQARPPLAVGSTAAGPGAPAPAGITGRQRARMADLSLLLDIVLKTNSQSVKKEFVACGILNQLHQAIGRNFGRDYCVIVRKILRVVEALPLTADDIYSVRSAHGTFANVLQELSNSPDFDVRSKAAAILKKYPLSACADPAIAQQHMQGPARKPGIPLYMRLGYTDKPVLNAGGSAAKPLGGMLAGAPNGTVPATGSGLGIAGAGAGAGALTPALDEAGRPRVLRPLTARPLGGPGPDGMPPPRDSSPQAASMADAEHTPLGIAAFRAGRPMRPLTAPSTLPTGAGSVPRGTPLGLPPLPPGGPGTSPFFPNAASGGAGAGDGPEGPTATPGGEGEGPSNASGGGGGLSLKRRRGAFMDDGPPGPGPGPGGPPFTPGPGLGYRMGSPGHGGPPWGRGPPPFGFDDGPPGPGLSGRLPPVSRFWHPRDGGPRDGGWDGFGPGREPWDRDRDWDREGRWGRDGGWEGRHGPPRDGGWDGRDMAQLVLDAEELFQALEEPGGSPPPLQGLSRRYWPYGEPTSLEDACRLHLLPICHMADGWRGEAAPASTGDGSSTAKGATAAGAGERRGGQEAGEGRLGLPGSQHQDRNSVRNGVLVLPLKRPASELALDPGAEEARGRGVGGAEGGEHDWAPAPLSPLSQPETYSPLRPDLEGAPSLHPSGGPGSSSGLGAGHDLLRPPGSTAGGSGSAAGGLPPGGLAGARPGMPGMPGSLLPTLRAPHHQKPIVMGLKDYAHPQAQQQLHVPHPSFPHPLPHSQFPHLHPGGALGARHASPSHPHGEPFPTGATPSGPGSAPLAGPVPDPAPVVVSLRSLRAGAAGEPPGGPSSNSAAGSLGGPGVAGMAGPSPGRGGMAGAVNGYPSAQAAGLSSMPQVSPIAAAWSNGAPGSDPGSSGRPVVMPVAGMAAAAARSGAGGTVAGSARTSPYSPVWDGWSRPPSQSHPDTWDAPDESFETFVAETVQHRIGKYVQPDHLNRIGNKDAHVLQRKIVREVIEKERRAHAERLSQSGGTHRPIERKKLEGNIKEFVRLSIRRFHTQATAQPQP